MVQKPRLFIGGDLDRRWREVGSFRTKIDQYGTGGARHRAIAYDSNGPGQGRCRSSLGWRTGDDAQTDSQNMERQTFQRPDVRIGEDGRRQVSSVRPSGDDVAPEPRPASGCPGRCTETRSQQAAVLTRRGRRREKREMIVHVSRAFIGDGRGARLAESSCEWEGLGPRAGGVGSAMCIAGSCVKGPALAIGGLARLQGSVPMIRTPPCRRRPLYPPIPEVEDGRRSGSTPTRSSLAACIVDEPAAAGRAHLRQRRRGARGALELVQATGPAATIGIEGSSRYCAAAAASCCWWCDAREVLLQLTYRERGRMRLPGKSDPGDAPRSRGSLRANDPTGAAVRSGPSTSACCRGPRGRHRRSGAGPGTGRCQRRSSCPGQRLGRQLRSLRNRQRAGGSTAAGPRGIQVVLADGVVKLRLTDREAAPLEAQIAELSGEYPLLETMVSA